MKKFLSMLLVGVFAVSPMVMAAEKKIEHKPVHKKWHKKVAHKKVEHKK